MIDRHPRVEVQDGTEAAFGGQTVAQLRLHGRDGPMALGGAPRACPGVGDLEGPLTTRRSLADPGVLAVGSAPDRVLGRSGGSGARKSKPPPDGSSSSYLTADEVDSLASGVSGRRSFSLGFNGGRTLVRDTDGTLWFVFAQDGEVKLLRGRDYKTIVVRGTTMRYPLFEVEWSTESVISAPGRYLVAPTLAVHGAGGWWIVCIDKGTATSLGDEGYVVAVNNQGRKLYEIDSNDGNSRPVVALADDGTAAVVYSTHVMSLRVIRLRMAPSKWTSGNWSSAVRVDQDSQGYGDATFPTVALASARAVGKLSTGAAKVIVAWKYTDFTGTQDSYHVYVREGTWSTGGGSPTPSFTEGEAEARALAADGTIYENTADPCLHRASDGTWYLAANAQVPDGDPGYPDPHVILGWTRPASARSGTSVRDRWGDAFVISPPIPLPDAVVRALGGTSPPHYYSQNFAQLDSNDGTVACTWELAYASRQNAACAVGWVALGAADGTTWSVDPKLAESQDPGVYPPWEAASFPAIALGEGRELHAVYLRHRVSATGGGGPFLGTATLEYLQGELGS